MYDDDKLMENWKNFVKGLDMEPLRQKRGEMRSELYGLVGKYHKFIAEEIALRKSAPAGTGHLPTERYLEAKKLGEEYPTLFPPSLQDVFAGPWPNTEVVWDKYYPEKYNKDQP